MHRKREETDGMDDRSDGADFTKLVPGFDFLQTLVKTAGATVPGVGQWVAPTLDPDEIDKRIGELRTVQFWLEQNARLLASTIQALEVQRMTLSTLKNMNVQMADLRDALTVRMPEAAAPAAAPSPAPPADAPAPAAKAAPARRRAPRAERAAETAAGAAVDPMQWWGALTRQFTEIASNALRETSAAAAAMSPPGAPPTAPAAPAAPATTPPAPASATAAGARRARAAATQAPNTTMSTKSTKGTKATKATKAARKTVSRRR
jgi:hypothetical protein